MLVTTSARRGAQPQKGHGGMVHDGSSRLGTVTPCPLSLGPQNTWQCLDTPLVLTTMRGGCYCHLAGTGQGRC